MASEGACGNHILLPGQRGSGLKEKHLGIVWRLILPGWKGALERSFSRWLGGQFLLSSETESVRPGHVWQAHASLGQAKRDKQTLILLGPLLPRGMVRAGPRPLKATSQVLPPLPNSVPAFALPLPNVLRGLHVPSPPASSSSLPPSYNPGSGAVEASGPAERTSTLPKLLPQATASVGLTEGPSRGSVSEIQGWGVGAKRLCLAQSPAGKR